MSFWSECEVSAKLRLDEHNIEVLAGDIPKGFWMFDGTAMKELQQGDAPKREIPVPLEQNIKEIKVRLKRKVNKLDSFSEYPVGHIIGMLNGKLLGPLGGIATSIVHNAAGSSEFICVGCELKDGRKFIAWMHDDIYKRWEKLHVDANPVVEGAETATATQPVTD